MKAAAIAAAVSIVLLAFAAHAAVPFAVLGGSCTPNVISHSGEPLHLTISDKGEAAATNMLVIPYISGATTPNATATSIGVMGFSNVSFSFPLYNLSTYGAHIASFTVRYGVGENFEPYYMSIACIYYIGRQTSSELEIANVSAAGSAKARNVSFRLYNMGSSMLNASAGVIAPFGFIINGSPAYLTVAPYKESNASFGLATNAAAQNGTFAMWAYATYVRGNLSYATMVPAEVQTEPPPKPAPAISLSSPLLAPAATVAAVAVLMALAALSMRRHSRRHRQRMHIRAK